MTSLLATSALYVVIFGTIPLVGYLTKLDHFSIGMFALLAVCVFIHQMVNQMAAKEDVWPLRSLAMRSLEVIGRIIVFPIAVLLFGYYFHDSSYSTLKPRFIAVLCIVVGAVLVRKIGG